MSMQHEEALSNLADRVHLLEDGMKMGKTRQDAIGKEVKVILAEIHIITEWIHQRFGVELLNKNSFLFKHIHDFEEVAEISATLCLLANVAGNAQKYTVAEVAAASAAAAAGNAAAQQAQAEHHARTGYSLGGASSTPPVSPSPNAQHRLRISSLPPPEHPPRPISTPPMISGQPLSYHPAHTLLIKQSTSPVQAHSSSIHHSNHSHHAPPSSHQPILSYHHGNSPPLQQVHLHHIQQGPPTSTITTGPITVQHHQQYILPHSPNSNSQSSTVNMKLSSQNLLPPLAPPPPPPPPSSSQNSPNSPTNLSQSQLIISKKSKPSHNIQQTMVSPSAPTPSKILLPPPPPPPPPSQSTSSGSSLTIKTPIPISVVTVVPTSSSNSQSQLSPQPYEHHSSSSTSSSGASSSAPASQPVTVPVHQPPPPPTTPTITHISVPPKKSLSSRNAHHNLTSGGSNIKKYFKPVVIVQQHGDEQQSSNRPLSPPPLSMQQKPTTGTLVESHEAIGQVYVFSDSNEPVQSPVVNNVDTKKEPPPPPVIVESQTGSMGNIKRKRQQSLERIDPHEIVSNTNSGNTAAIVRPVTPVNTTIPTPDPDTLRPKRSKRKKGYGSSKPSSRLLNNDGGRSPNHNANSLDYTADTEDEVPSSRDSTPVMTSKRKSFGSPKPLKTSTPITTTPKSSKQHHHQLSQPSTPIGPPEGIAESPIAGPSHAALANLNSSSNSSINSASKHDQDQQNQSGDEESSSTGTSEKLPKRGRPKKRPEERVRTYDPRVPMQCDECGKVLKGTGALRVHKQIHQNIRPYDCTVCGRAFRRKHHLEFHMMIHEGNKKETCSYCGKAFLIRRDLARHERTHTGEKPYSCHLCPKSFNVKQHLTLHIRTHTGERPYRCPICDKTFTQANSLRIHKKIHLRDRERAAGSGAGNAGGSGGNASAAPSGGGGGNKGGKTKGGNGANRNSCSTSTNSNASNSSVSSGTLSSSTTTSGISSASTSALETPERIRPPSSSGAGSRVASPTPSMRSGQSSPPSPSVRQHPLLQHVHVPPPVAETVTVVTSPPAHLTGHLASSPYDSSRSEHRGDHGYHGGSNTQPSSPPTTWRLSLNPGSGTNLISPPGTNGGSNSRDGRSPPPQSTFTIPAAHQVQSTAGGHPGHYAVIRNMGPSSTSGGSGPTLVRAYIPSPESHHHSNSGDGRSPPPSGSSAASIVTNTVPAHHHNHIHHGQSPPNSSSGVASSTTTATYTIYDPSNVTRYYN